MSRAERKPVATDASVLINFALIDRLMLLGAFSTLRFVVPEPVLAEVRYPQQRARVHTALARRYLYEVATDEPAVLARLARLRQRMGLGEAACLALAVEKGWLFACDEGGFVRNEASRLLGPDRLLNSAGLFLLAIRRGLWTVEEADEAKAALETNRFRMPFESFRDQLSS